MDVSSPALPVSPWRAASAQGRRWLLFIHRWLGVITCLFCAMWFGSGVVMMYVPFPALSAAERISLLEPIAASAIGITPTQAVRVAGLNRFPDRLVLDQFGAQPVYRIRDGARTVTVSAVTGALVTDLTPADALAVIRHVRPETPARVTTVWRDQWTVTPSFDAYRPLFKIRLGDPPYTDLYVSGKTGEVVDATTARERFWNWFGSIPHWLYPGVRHNPALWRQVVIWVSGPALVGAVTGVWVGLLRLRLRRRYGNRNGRVSPYRGWMKWHHIAGLVAGVFLVTWVASGWLSMKPFHWFSVEQVSSSDLSRYADHALPSFPSDLPTLQRLPPDAREVRMTWIHGRPLLVVSRAGQSDEILDGVSTAPVRLEDRDLFAAAGSLRPGAPVAFKDRLTHADSYWYERQPRFTLPVDRIGFADHDRTWFFIDPKTGDIVGRSTSGTRLYRWLFYSVHDFDVHFLRDHRPLWDVVVGILALGGLIISVTGVVISWRRLGQTLFR